MTLSASPVGPLLRSWRQRRRLSQLDLALAANISTRHLSFLETGRAHPSREMLLHLAEQLEVPLRERNRLLQAAGFASVYPERPLQDPALTAARAAVELVLKGHEPYPALALDRHWTLLAANAAVAPLLAGVDPGLLQPPINVLRLSLHPAGLAPRIANLPEWRAHLLARLRHQIAATADPALETLLRELTAYPAGGPVPTVESGGGFVVPLRLILPQGRFSFLSTTTVFGTPLDVTLAELALEAFYPADRETAALLSAPAPASSPASKA